MAFLLTSQAQVVSGKNE